MTDEPAQPTSQKDSSKEQAEERYHEWWNTYHSLAAEFGYEVADHFAELARLELTREKQARD